MKRNSDIRILKIDTRTTIGFIPDLINNGIFGSLCDKLTMSKILRMKYPNIQKETKRLMNIAVRKKFVPNFLWLRKLT